MYTTTYIGKFILIADILVSIANINNPADWFSLRCLLLPDLAKTQENGHGAGRDRLTDVPDSSLSNPSPMGTAACVGWKGRSSCWGFRCCRRPQQMKLLLAFTTGEDGI